MPIVLPNVIRMAFRGNWSNGEEVVNVLDLEVTGNGLDVSREEAVDATVADAVQNWQSQLVEVILPNNYTFIGADWVDLDSLDGRTGFEPPNAGEGTVGVGVAPVLGPQAATVVRKLCASRGRGRRNGRWYLPIATESNVDENGVTTGTSRTAVRNACLAFRTNVNQTGILDDREVAIGVVSDPADLPALFMPITDFQVSALVGTQRRRLNKDAV